MSWPQMEAEGERVVEVSQGRSMSQLLQRVYEVDGWGGSVNVKCRGVVWDGIQKQKMKKPRRAGLREKSQGARARARVAELGLR